MRNRDVYKKITDNILEMMKDGIIPWKQQWSNIGTPANLVSKKFYRGVNQLILRSRNMESPWWLTYRQTKRLGGNVKKGEKATVIVFWKILDSTEINQETGNIEITTIPLLRYYHVFNSTQCELPDDVIPKVELNDSDPIDEAEKVLRTYIERSKVSLQFGGDRACYYHVNDEIDIPPIERFVSPESYYSVMFHEITHSTGHKSRLNRKGVAEDHMFGDPVYSKEELVAELGSAFVTGRIGIRNNELEQTNASYIQSWMKALKDDETLLFRASKEAEIATGYIFGDNDETV